MYLFLFRNMKIGTKQHVLNQILCKAAYLNRRPIREKGVRPGVCSDSNRRTAQRLQIAARKSLETMSGVILIRLQPKFAVKSVPNEM